jgi:LysR family glycine cleavage system transcriptional activator
LARLRSVTQTAEELNVTPSAVSHRVKQLEQILGTRLFGRADFSLTTEGSEYLAHVREGAWPALERFPGRRTPVAACKRKLRVAVTPTFSRSILMPRLRGFIEAYPEIDVTLQVSIPLLDVVAEDADLMVRFGTGRYADVEHTCLMTKDVSRRWHRRRTSASTARLTPCTTCWAPSSSRARWSRGAPGSLAHHVDAGEPAEGSQFNDIGLMCDAAAAGHGHCAGAPEAGRALAGQRLAGAHLHPQRAQPARPLPVLAHRRHGPLGMRGLRRVVAQKHALARTDTA